MLNDLVDLWDIRLSFDSVFKSGVLYGGSFNANYKKRTDELVFSVSAYQSALTVACTLSHRRMLECGKRW